ETTYRADTWNKARRIVMVRQEEKKRTNAVGKKIASGCLFPEEYEAGKYRYSCYVTNMTLPSDLIWRTYRGRADSENRIKEIKYDFAFDHFVLKDFWASEAAMNFIIMAYNLISLFRHTLINSPKKPFLKTIRYKLFAIPGYITSHAKGKTLKLALGVKRRLSFMGIWEAAQEFDPKIMF
ncbi:MAG: transposase, partial [Bacteroidales bacterium]|nr:transposase [Bacteroidales bacterium]